MNFGSDGEMSLCKRCKNGKLGVVQGKLAERRHSLNENFHRKKQLANGQLLSNKHEAAQSVLLRVSSATDKIHELVRPIAKSVLLADNYSSTERWLYLFIYFQFILR